MATETAKGKLLPFNMDVERSLLGSILLENSSLDAVSDFIQPEHFYEKFHAKLYEIMRAAIRAGKIASIDTIKDLLSLPGHYALLGTSLDFYLQGILAIGCTPFNAGDYGKQLRHLAIRRELIKLADEIQNNAYSAPADANASTQIQDIEKKLFNLADSHIPNSGFMPFAEVLASAVKMANDAYNREGKLAGISTGFSDLDSKLGGLQRSDLIIIGGRPGMGKTALATNIAYKIAKAWQGREDDDGNFETYSGGRIGFFSLEMSAEQIGTRIISDETNINSSDIRRGSFKDPDFVKMRDVERDMGHIPLFIDQTGGLTVAQVCSRARRLKRKNGLDVIVIDYLQLMAGGSNKRNDNRVQELTEITSSLKALAKELNVPIIALSQLSRQVENREDKRPQLNDLRESGSIEQDADVVLFVFREAYYLELRQPKEGTVEIEKWQKEMAAIHDKVEVIIAKQRHGMTGKIDMHFDRTVTRFSNAAKPDQSPDSYGPIGTPAGEYVPF